MKASNITQHESTFRKTGIDSSGTKFILSDETVSIKDKVGGPITFVDCRKEVADESYFLNEEFPKERIVLHFTAGYLRSDIAQLSRKGVEVSVPFVISRSGHIYNLWKSKLWSYHLGPGAIGGNTAMSQRSIGIEISNIGYLEKTPGGILHSHFGIKDVYCKESETAYYQKLPLPFRSERYYATYTNAQYTATILLLRYLTARYKIPRTLLPIGKRFDPFANAAEAENFKGICTHVNFRPKDKWDIGPAFDWARVEKGLKLGA